MAFPTPRPNSPQPRYNIAGAVDVAKIPIANACTMKLTQATALRSSRSKTNPVAMRPKTAARVVRLTAQPAGTAPIIGDKNAI